MRRREFITLIGGAAALAPWAARAQQAGRTYRLGALIPAPRQSPAIVAFFDEMRLIGFAEGQNLIVIPNGFDVSNDALPEKAAALVAAAPDVILSGPDHYARALQRATGSIPIVAMSEDMLGAGLVPSLARPGGNTTGISLMSPELNTKRQDLLLEAVPRARKIAALLDSTITQPAQIQRLQDAARARGVELIVHSASRREDTLSAIDAAAKAGAEAINFLASPLFGAVGSDHVKSIIGRVRELRIPAIHQWPEQADDGGLIGYGARIAQVFRQRARLVARVLRGAKPADIPVEQPTTFELVINLRTAKAIGHEIPAGLVLRADKVIE